MTDHTLNLLARAEKDGEPVHDLLLKCPSETHDPCSKEFGYSVRGATYYEQIDIPTCTNGYIPNPELMALIAAAQKQGWQVWFTREGHVELPYVRSGEGNGADNQAALINAMVQATAPLVDNWVECVSCLGDGEIAWSPVSNPMPPQEVHRETCAVCAGTGYVEADHD